MPDLTLCTNATCPLAFRCYRQTASPSEYQSYMEFKPDVDGCEFYIPVRVEKKEADNG